MKGFLVTTTYRQSDAVINEILRIDPKAAIAFRREDKTLLMVRSSRMSEWSFDSIAGVAHAVNLTNLGLEVPA